MHFGKRDLEAVLGFQVTSWPGPYVVAFTHESASQRLGVPSYERLEWLGDAVIQRVVTKWLFDTFPAATPGAMTQMRTRLVSGDSLARLARCLGLSRFLVTDVAENTKVLADIFESLVGAIFLDAGDLTAKQFVLSVIGRFVSVEELLTNRNFKDQLLQLSHKLKVDHPKYSVISYAKNQYVVEVTVGSKTARGAGVTKKEAEQASACSYLQRHPPAPSAPPGRQAQPPRVQDHHQAVLNSFVYVV